MKYENVILLGTTHISEESARHVEEVIEKEKPDAIAIELCERRLKRMKNVDIPIFELIRRGEFLSTIFSFIASEAQKEIGKKFNIIPGYEMIKALEIAKRYKIPVELIDRDINVTIKRLMSELNFIDKLKIFIEMLKTSSIEKEELEKIMEKLDVEKFITEIKKNYPKLYKVLIDERDKYMAWKLLKLKEKYNKILAIVGKGHVPGIIHYLKNPNEIGNINELLYVKSNRAFKIFFIIILLLIISFLIYKNVDIINYSKIWFLNNFIPTFILVLIARGHLLTAIASSTLAPITSLLPFVSAGIVALFVESYVRKITLKEIFEIFHANSFRELFGKKAFKILLVSLAATIGSLIGTLISMENVIIPILKEIK